MRDLESISRSEGTEIHYSETLPSKETKDQFHFSKNGENSRVTEEPAAMNSDAFQAVTTGQSTLSLLAYAACFSLRHVDNANNPMDVNTKANITNNTVCDLTTACIDDNSEVSLLTKQDKDPNHNFVTSISTGLDLNAEYAPNSVGQDPFYPYQMHGLVKSREASECGSSTGHLEEHDSFRAWKELKQNGFLSSAHGGIPMPNQRGRKRKSDLLRKNVELAKREQVNRFTKIAAPSGLLNGLNPGIINHVRNSKQVHSIIEALVRSEKLENSIQSRSTSHSKRGIKEINEISNGPENMHDSGISRPGIFHEDEPPNTLSRSRQTPDYHMSSSISTIPLSSEQSSGCGNSDMTQRRVHDQTFGASHLTSDYQDETLALRLSSSTNMVPENTSVSKEKSASQASVPSLSVKAATVASQWLELLYQDIKGRISALRRSKKRIQSVIQTELPFLMSREFSSNLENDPCFRQFSSVGCPNNLTPDMHRTKWTALFDQMEKTLSEEGKHLESWLNQVKEMQLHCEWGLQLSGRSENDPGSKKENAERELSIRAAAASIYSTGNFVRAREDAPHF